MSTHFYYVVSVPLKYAEIEDKEQITDETRQYHGLIWGLNHSECSVTFIAFIKRQMPVMQKVQKKNVVQVIGFLKLCSAVDMLDGEQLRVKSDDRNGYDRPIQTSGHHRKPWMPPRPSAPVAHFGVVMRWQSINPESSWRRCLRFIFCWMQKFGGISSVTVYPKNQRIKEWS